MIELQVCDGLPLTMASLTPSQDACIQCIVEKQTRKSFKTPTTNHPEFEVGESIHIDDWEGTKTDGPSLSGATGKLEIMEEISGILLGMAIRRKSDEAQYIIEIIKFLE